MYGVYWECRPRVTAEHRAKLNETEEGQKLLKRNDVWGREKKPYVACYNQARAEAIANLLTEDRATSEGLESRYVVVDEDA